MNLISGGAEAREDEGVKTTVDREQLRRIIPKLEGKVKNRSFTAFATKRTEVT